MLEYQIALVNVFWSQNDINNRFFSSTQEQEEYFNALTGGKYSSLVNYNMGDNIETSITYRDNSGRDIDELISCNYAVVKRIKDNDITYRYFFAQAKQDSGNQLRVNLSLDDFQTNYIKYRNQIGPCMINRACLNRFVESGQAGVVKFDASLTSKLFEEETITETSKRLVKRTKVNINTSFKNKTIGKWLNENVYGFLYVFLDSTHAYKFFNKNKNETTDNFIVKLTYNNLEGSSHRISSQLYCACIPICNGKKSIKFKERFSQVEYDYDIGALNEFFKNNNDYTYCYAIKFIPFMIDNRTLNSIIYEIDGAGNLIVDCEFMGGDNYLECGFGRLGITSNTKNDVILLCDYQSNVNIECTYNIDREFEFNKSDIIGSVKSPKFNPKLLNEKYQSIRISDGQGEGFEYSLQKINKNNINLLYTEGITPDISRRYIRLLDNDYYITDLAYNGTGFTNTDDTSLTMVTSAYQSMLANNKNFYLQATLGRIIDASSSIKGAINSGITGNIGGVVSNTLGGVTNYATSLINQNLNIDNVKSSPASVNNLKGNIINQLMYSPPGCYVEEYSIIDNEKEIINDYMNEFGFTYNQTDYLTNVDNIRKYYNYVEAEIETINVPINNVEKERLKQRMRSIRMWNSDNIDYTNENYERWLENE